MKFNSVQSLFSLANKVAIVTGAAGYLGKAFSESLLFAGAKVVLLGRGERIVKVADSFKEKYGDDKVDFYQVDFFDEKAHRNSLLDSIDKNKKIDILVNNAFEFSKKTGFNDPSGKVETISREQWMRGLESGVYWPALSTQVIGEKMKQQGNGSIINISSMYAIISPDPDLYKGVDVFNPPVYSASKAAIMAFTKYSASFYGEYGMRCNAILPGSFPNVGMDSYNSPPKDEGFINRLNKKTILGRCGVPEDLMGSLIFLASDSSSYITGQGIVVDGGWSVR